MARRGRKYLPTINVFISILIMRKIDLVIAVLLFVCLFMSSSTEVSVLERRIKELEANAAYYLMYDEEKTQAQINAGGLDPGTVYKASDGNTDVHFVNTDGPPKKASTVNTSGVIVQSEQVQIAETAIVRATITANQNDYNPVGFDRCVSLFLTFY